MINIKASASNLWHQVGGGLNDYLCFLLPGEFLCFLCFSFQRDGLAIVLLLTGLEENLGEGWGLSLSLSLSLGGVPKL